MCGIIGVFNRKNHKELVEKGLEIIKYRGLDGKKVYSNINYSIGHLLHSIVGFVEQPIKNRFVANCEIYNWEELNRKYNLKAKNDAELLFYFVDKGLDLDELDGSYAFALIKDDKVILARDILGIKPLWYTNKDGFMFASEKKVFKEMIELNPRKILVYENNIPLLVSTIPVGGDDITKDIALGLRISLDEAEQLKLGAITNATYSKKKFDDILTARLTDIFELIDGHLKKLGKDQLLPAGIVLSGGGSGIGPIKEIAESALKLHSKIASLNIASDAKIKDSSWAVAYGLCIWGVSTEDESIGIKIAKETSGNVIRWIKRFLP